MAANARFFAGIGPQHLATLLAGSGAALAEGSPADAGARAFTGVAALAEAGPDEISYLEAARHNSALAGSRSGAVVLRAEDAGLIPAGCLAIISTAPALTFSHIAKLFHPTPTGSGQRHSLAAIAATAQVARDADIGAFAVVGEGAEIGSGCILHPHAVVGPGVVLGEGCVIHSHASVSHAVLGRAVVLHPGARIGQEGFGFTPTADGRFITMPQLGSVVLGDEVEIGANACVDRGALGDTVIGRGTRVDNLVQIGHNVQTGQGCVLVAQVGISGSTILEDRVQMAGQAAVVGHVRIGAGARIGAQAGVINHVPAGADYLGSPAQPARQELREIAAVRRLVPRSKPAVAAKPVAEEKGS